MGGRKKRVKNDTFVPFGTFFTLYRPLRSDYVYDGGRENNVYSGRCEGTALTPFLRVSNAAVGRRIRKIHIEDKHDKSNV